MVCHIDLLVSGQDQGEHDTRLHTMLQRLEKAGITLNVDKCERSKSEVVFLVHIITAVGICPDPRMTEAIMEMKEPTDVGKLTSLFWMVNNPSTFISIDFLF